MKNLIDLRKEKELREFIKENALELKGRGKTSIFLLTKNKENKEGFLITIDDLKVEYLEFLGIGKLIGNIPSKTYPNFEFSIIKVPVFNKISRKVYNKIAEDFYTLKILFEDKKKNNEFIEFVEKKLINSGNKYYELLAEFLFMYYNSNIIIDIHKSNFLTHKNLVIPYDIILSKEIFSLGSF